MSSLEQILKMLLWAKISFERKTGAIRQNLIDLKLTIPSNSISTITGLLHLDRAQYDGRTKKAGSNNVTNGKVEAYGFRSMAYFKPLITRTDIFEHLGVLTTWAKWTEPIAGFLSCWRERVNVLAIQKPGYTSAGDPELAPVGRWRFRKTWPCDSALHVHTYMQNWQVNEYWKSRN